MTKTKTTTTMLKRLAVAPLAWPAIGGAHALSGGVPHGHAAAAWGAFAAATTLCWAAYRAAQRLSARREAMRRSGRRAVGR